MKNDAFNDAGLKVLSPASLAHVVLRTGNFVGMKEFYKTFTGGYATHENDFLSFITYDEEHHRIAIAAVPGTGPKVPSSSGLGTINARLLPLILDWTNSTSAPRTHCFHV
jgi:catechol-2,3-dioxygenase